MRYWHAVVPSLNLAYIGEPMDAASGHVWQALAYDEIVLQDSGGDSGIILRPLGNAADSLEMRDSCLLPSCIERPRLQL